MSQFDTKRSGGGLLSRDAAEEYELLMKSMQVSVSKHLLDEYFTVVWSNEFYYQLIGYPKEDYEALFHNRPDIYYAYHHYEDELEKLRRCVMKAINTGETQYAITTRMPVKGGGHIWVQLQGFFTQKMYNGYNISYTTMVNVDDLVKIQREQSITYNNLPGFAAKFLIKEHLHFELIDANKRFINFFGGKDDKSSYEELFKKNVEANREVILSQMGRVRRGEHICGLTKMMSQKGQTSWLQIYGDCVDWIGGDPVYVLIYIDVTDVTELREMQKKLEEQARDLQDALESARHANEAKRSFLSRMSHEIRTPLNAIIGLTTIAAAYRGNEGRRDDCLKKIGLSSKHLLSLINDVLDMSKIEDGKLSVFQEPFCLQQVLESVTAFIYPQAAAQGLNFRLSMQEPMEKKILGDAMRVSQILLNLLSNAVKFTPEGGQMELRVERLRDKGVRFVISDTGRGMSQQFLERLYEPFEQEFAAAGNPSGTGLGMAITKNLIVLLGGTIAVRSALGKGTVFTVELPFRYVGEQERSARYPDMESLKVLVTDDNADDCSYASLLLEQLGINAVGVLSGKEAVEEISRAHADGEDYDVCFVDWRMPEMNGIETTRRIRSIVGPDTLIIILTAYDYGPIEADARAAGANMFLSKPLFASTIYNTLISVTGNGAARESENGRYKPSTSLLGRRILLVEDNALNQEIAVEILQMADAEVVCVEDGQEAVDWFLSDEGGNCDAVLMDIQLPKMNGYQAARAIRAADRPNAKSIPIIAMTADAFREDVAAALEAGMNAHVAKPIELDLLYKTLADCMKLRAGRP